MKPDFQIGVRVQLSEVGKRTARVLDRRGVVLRRAKSSETQFVVLWDGLRSAQLMHWTFLQLEEPRSSAVAGRAVLPEDAPPKDGQHPPAVKQDDNQERPHKVDWMHTSSLNTFARQRQVGPDARPGFWRVCLITTIVNSAGVSANTSGAPAKNLFRKSGTKSTGDTCSNPRGNYGNCSRYQRF
jgi:hypothetical protein